MRVKGWNRSEEIILNLGYLVKFLDGGEREGCKIPLEWCESLYVKFIFVIIIIFLLSVI